MNYVSTTEFHPKLSSAEDVTFVLRKISHGSRIKLNQMASSTFDKLNDITRDVVPIRKDIEDAEQAAKAEPCTCSHDASDGSHDEKSGRCNTPGCHCREPRPSDPDAYEKSYKLNMKFLEVRYEELFPIYIRWGVKGIQGLTINDEPATVESLLDEGLEELVREVAEEIIRLIKLSPDELVGFKLPITSGAVADGQTNGTTVPFVSEIDYTPKDAARSSSPA
jgi:hypothetical protein